SRSRRCSCISPGSRRTVRRLPPKRDSPNHKRQILNSQFQSDGNWELRICLLWFTPYFSPQLNVRPPVTSGHVFACPNTFGIVRPLTPARRPTGPHNRSAFTPPP